MARRKLTPDEVALWHKVNATTERRLPDPAATPPPKPTPRSKPVKTPRAQRVAPPSAGSVRKPTPDAAVAPKPKSGIAMDRKAYGRMRRGKLTPEARIDLHGMTLDRAHPALTRFILAAHANGLRLVLVITGKGQSPTGSPDRPRGVLKRQVPDWLARPPLSRAVLQISQAHVSHGGSGALYVYLRRER
ncbi:MAG: Smr/MutS family protein [Marinibacterium sp.]